MNNQDQQKLTNLKLGQSEVIRLEEEECDCNEGYRGKTILSGGDGVWTCEDCKGTGKRKRQVKYSPDDCGDCKSASDCEGSLNHNKRECNDFILK